MGRRCIWAAFDIPTSPSLASELDAWKFFADHIRRYTGVCWSRQLRNNGSQTSPTSGQNIAPPCGGCVGSGKLLGSVQLASGRFAMIDDGLGFTLVPWRPVIEREIGREVMGVMRGNDIFWQLVGPGDSALPGNKHLGQIRKNLR